jgi:hypothetical protein
MVISVFRMNHVCISMKNMFFGSRLSYAFLTIFVWVLLDLRFLRPKLSI